MGSISPPPLSLVSKASLKRLGDEKAASETILSDDIWKDQPALILVLRRPGCRAYRIIPLPMLVLLYFHSKTAIIYRGKLSSLVCCLSVLCRAEAKSLYALKPDTDKLGVRMVCVVHEGLPAEIKAFWPDYW